MGCSRWVAKSQTWQIDYHFPFFFFFRFPLLCLLKRNENIYKSSSFPKRTVKRGIGNCTLLQVKKRLTFLRISFA